MAIIVTKAASRGQARIYLDGSTTPAATIDTYVATTAYQAQVWAWTWSGSGAHTVKVAVVGTAGRPRVDLDAISVLK